MPAVREARPGDESAWRDLWRQYVTFYEADVPEAVTAATWARLLAGRDGFVGRVAEDASGRVVGFSVSIVHGGSWSIAPVCYLEDLFVAPAARGQRVGRALIEDLFALGRAGAWGKVYWHTRVTNASARRLYDSFGPADDFVRYRLDVE